MSIGTEGGEGTTLAVYVLRGSASASRSVIDLGSAIVGRMPTRDDHVLVYYESNRYGAENMHRFEDKVFHAASRLVTSYPTSAMAAVKVDQLEVVGLYDYESRELKIIDQAALNAWLEEAKP